ncbi:hypothetical protein GGF32_002700 [Allomyces javanicus]|nr:hypothetical protein GGF32_002700 [Allomyces javanicus]
MNTRPNLLSRFLTRTHVELDQLVQYLVQANNATECHVFIANSHRDMRCVHSSTGRYSEDAVVSTAAIEQEPVRHEVALDRRVISVFVLDAIDKDLMQTIQNELKTLVYFSYMRRIELQYLGAIQLNVLEGIQGIYNKLSQIYESEPRDNVAVAPVFRKLTIVHDNLVDSLMGVIAHTSVYADMNLDEFLASFQDILPGVTVEYSLDNDVQPVVRFDPVLTRAFVASFLKYLDQPRIVLRMSVNLEHPIGAGILELRLTCVFVPDFEDAVRSRYIDKRYLCIPLAARFYHFSLKSFNARTREAVTSFLVQYQN